jgi:hypothetical protein
MRILIIVLTIIAISVQVVIASFWGQSEYIKDLGSFYKAFYGEVPPWINISISLGYYWCILSVILLSIMVFGIFKSKTNKFLFAVFGVSVLFLIAMVYVMYPIHLMVNSPV